MTSAALQPGSLFAGRYRVETSIAEGGMGAVYEVVHAETGRRHALKVMHAHTLSSPELRDRFRQEARVAANVQSEFIVDVFDAGVDAGSDLPFLVMELLQGEELGRLLQRRGRFSAEETVTYLGQVAMALDRTHRAMIVHRDLKPENLFLTHRDDGSPRIKVLDFGVAKIVAETSTNAAATRSLGTPLYMAPEQFEPGNKVSPATDLYAVAMIAYTFLVGMTYWAKEAAEAANVFSFALTAIRGPKESPCARAQRLGVQLPPAFDAWFARAAHVDPAMRFPGARAMLLALAEAFGVPPPFRAAPGDPLAGSGANPVAMPAMRLAYAAPPAAEPPSSTVAMTGAARPPASLPMSSAQPVPPGPPSAAVYPRAQLSSSQPNALAVSQAPPMGAVPAVTGHSPAQVGITGGLTTTGPIAPAGAGKKLIFAGAGVLAVAIAVVVFLVIPRDTPGTGAPGPSANPTAATADPPSSSVPVVSPSPTELPTATPSADPSSSSSAAPSASAPTTSEPGSKGPGAKPKPKGPRPPGTSVYIRD